MFNKGFLAHGITVAIPKQRNDELSGIGTSKFEFSTIINHYEDIHNGILHKKQKTHKMGGVLALKVPGGCEPEFCRGRQYYLYVHNICLSDLAKFQNNLMDG